ncbi:uncharacterized protein SCHCODRAFT_02642233 [Schizophyllum commune H4-8]|uniref:uncharacterized protein n=1 Tax=Schizophyllum commune (strain H4-8 / FGSC 9210) TaxID=578458 RepID=UPI00215DE361|nr:uncharacterized protein SCHCODRAFT_02642233 [Schizophyllum commune H4-8]KAI5886634.1 hypothetical protein SCHCODRAFT_02642233 [Schizophyllum commune H4-8]
MDAAQAIFENPSQVSAIPILAGSFRSLSLFLLAFTYAPNNGSSISFIHQSDTAFGPHQYIALNARRDRAYTTSWGSPPILSSWEIAREQQIEHWRVSHINNAPITATSSYIALTPPSNGQHIYSMGGPTGEVHTVDPETGGFGQKVQEVLFVEEGELEKADKTRKALREGSHGIEFLLSSTPRLAFVPVLGTDAKPGTIEVYTHDPATGLLSYLHSTPPPPVSKDNDGPRHVKLHPNGRVLYCVTEHTNRIDVYTIDSTSKTPLTYATSHALMPPPPPRTHYRGSTLQLAPSTSHYPAPRAILTSTRGGSEGTNGWIGIHPLDAAGDFTGTPRYHELSTSGGKSLALAVMSKPGDETRSWVLVSDDAEGAGGVRVIEWNHETDELEELAMWGGDADVDMQGSSFSLWLD